MAEISEEACRRAMRSVADAFVLQVAFTADRLERDPAALADEAITDSIARLTERGVIRKEWFGWE